MGDSFIHLRNTYWVIAHVWITVLGEQDTQASALTEPTVWQGFQTIK